jgi:hypothetical protein
MLMAKFLHSSKKQILKPAHSAGFFLSAFQLIFLGLAFA